MGFEYTINYLQKRLRKLEWLSDNKPNNYMEDQIQELERAIQLLNIEQTKNDGEKL